ncbi:transglycosylase domain-containing protein [Rossellomorea sp. YZS02]|uniref:transglycosylase domain-containing protein n=1 Tax=Rossellomorea sp. YZS02 TaxID=3097358 RepID=UPI002A0EDDC0|nr:transglycosylase domain-containing protein [Rossellomorea sp. YZS02]MDX8346193.1 transglycosylase domain-containing protein [Rossellomorea sp. YZS02]
MRVFAGYITVISFMLIFFITLFFATDEWNKVQSFQQELEHAVSADTVDLNRTSLLLDKDGRVFSEVNRPYRLYVPDEKIPPFLKDILVASEDQHFYEHVGFDAGAILRAVVKNLVFTHIQQGGSTITQQLARNLYLGQEKTYNRKLTELFYAHEIEQTLSKDEILELYMNVIYFSNGVYGIETASQYYFQKSVAELNQAEMAFIASIPNNPGKYDPVDHFDQTKVRQERLLDILVSTQKLSKDEAEKLKKVPISLNVRKKTDLYPDYAFYVENELKELIARNEGYVLDMANASSPEEKKKIGEKLDDRYQEVISSGVRIQTALNPAIQKKSISALNAQLNMELQGATVTIDNKTRTIVALSGGRNYKKYNFNHAFQAFRQPGSAIKPLLVYGPYIEKFKAGINDKVNANQYCVGEYCPINYGGAQPGTVTLQQSMAQSYNGSAVRLMEKVGVEKAFQSIAPFSFEKVIKEDKTYAASIGGFTYGMSPLELTDAYTSFIDGNYQASHAILHVKDNNGKILYQWKNEPKKVWSADTTSKIRKMLNEGAKTGTGRAAYVSRPYVGIKTGTTNNYHDYWVMGLTDTLTTGVWVGHDIPRDMSGIEQQRPSHKIWKSIME